jgi:hypothetical protein
VKKIFQTIKSLTVNLTWKMVKALLSKPFWLVPTIWATVQSILYAENYFFEAHGGRGIANAFRHSAWNLLIAKNVSFYTTEEKAIKWAKFITDMHEECFPNDEFDNQMDLHNNRLGREIFAELRSKDIKKTREMMEVLFEKSKSGVGLKDEKEFVKHPDEMVFFAEY